MTADEIRAYAKERADRHGFPADHAMRAIFLFELLVQDLASRESELSRLLRLPADVEYGAHRRPVEARQDREASSHGARASRLSGHDE